MDSVQNLVIDIKKACRFCLKENINLFPLNANCILSDFDHLKISDLLLQTFDFNIANNDNIFPRNLCEECLQATLLSYNFKKQILRCDDLLKFHLVDVIKTESGIIPAFDDASISNVESLITQDVDEAMISINTPIECQSNQINCDDSYEEPKVQEQTEEDENFTCPTCNKQFNSKKDFDKHNLTHELSNSFMCSICDKHFKFKQSLTRHIISHSRKENITCSECNLSCKDDNQLQRHKKLAHSGQVHKCTHCSKVFSHLSRLQRHLLCHKKEEERRLKCKYCTKRFNFYHHLRNHERIHTGSKPYVCYKCGRGFNQSNNLTIHLKHHEEVKPFPCNYCSKSFAQPQRLKRHLLCHTGEKPFLCNSCGKRFCDNITLQKHLKNHEPSEKEKNSYSSRLSKTSSKNTERKNSINLFSSLEIEENTLSDNVDLNTMDQTVEKSSGETVSCKVCNETFENSDACGVHMRTHTCIYVCNICNRRFTLQSTLEKHLQSHNTLRIRDHVCGECGHSYTRKEHLKAHVRRAHLCEKPHSCPHCPKSFAAAGELNIHLRRHTGEKPYVCSFCNKAFPSSTALKIHFRTHTGEKPHKCNLCSKAFTTSTALLGHTKIHSANEPKQPINNTYYENNIIITVIDEATDKCETLNLTVTNE